MGTSDTNARGEVNWAHWIAGQAGVVPISLDDNENDTSGPGSAKTASHRAFARKMRACYVLPLSPAWFTSTRSPVQMNRYRLRHWSGLTTHPRAA